MSPKIGSFTPIAIRFSSISAIGDCADATTLVSRVDRRAVGPPDYFSRYIEKFRIRRRDFTPWVGVNCSFILGGVMHAFYYVYLTTRWPVGPYIWIKSFNNTLSAET